jgi:hypothetical protein
MTNPPESYRSPLIAKLGQNRWNDPKYKARRKGVADIFAPDSTLTRAGVKANEGVWRGLDWLVRHPFGAGGSVLGNSASLGQSLGLSPHSPKSKGKSGGAGKNKNAPIGRRDIVGTRSGSTSGSSPSLADLYGAQGSAGNPLLAAFDQLRGQYADPYGASRQSMLDAYARLMQDNTSAIATSERQQLQAALDAIAQARTNEIGATNGAFDRGRTEINGHLQEALGSISGQAADVQGFFNDAATTVGGYANAGAEVDGTGQGDSLGLGAVGVTGEVSDIADSLASDGASQAALASNLGNINAGSIRSIAAMMEGERSASTAQLGREALLGEQLARVASADRLAKALEAERRRTAEVEMAQAQAMSAFDQRTVDHQMDFDMKRLELMAKHGEETLPQLPQGFFSHPVIQAIEQSRQSEKDVTHEVPRFETINGQRVAVGTTPISEKLLLDRWLRSVSTLPSERRHAEALWVEQVSEFSPEELSVLRKLGIPMDATSAVNIRTGVR